MYRVRHLRLGVARIFSLAVISAVVATMVLSTALLPWPEPALAAIAVQSVELVSVDSSEIQGNNYGRDFSISADGRYVAFDSLSNNLVAGDSGTSLDVFVRDRLSGETKMVSLNSDNVQGDGWSYQPSISADGRYVAFHSSAGNLADDDEDGLYDDDTNGLYDVFVRDRQTGETTRESLNSDNAENPYNGSWEASISADGRYVAFTSGSSSMVPGDTNYSDDIFVRDHWTYTTTRVSVATDNTQGNDRSMWPSISANGQYVAFVSLADNLIGAGNDNNDRADVFVHDLVMHTTTRVSVADNEAEANNESTWFSINPDGRYVAFASWANNLVSGDVNGNGDVFVRDLVAGETTRVSVTSGGAEVSGNCVAPSISANGRYVAFRSVATTLVPGDGNGEEDMFIHDRQTGETARISTSAGGVEGNDESTTPMNPPGGRYISASGQYVAFASSATNLVAGGSTGYQFFMAQLTVQPDVSQPDIAVTPANHAFTGVALGGSAQLVFTVHNNGTDNLTIGTVAAANPLAAPFSIVTDGCSGQTIPPDDSRTLTVQFSPTVKGSFSDSFNIPSNDPDTPSATVNLTGATLNTAPTAPVVDVTPNSPTTTADLVCSITTPSTDSDNDTITYTYQWYKGGALQAALTTNTVAAASTAKGEVWKCAVTPNDGTINGSPDEDQVTIQNSAPTAPTVAVTPDSPDTTADLVCSIATQSTDADGDSVAYTYQWYKDNVLQSGLTTNTAAAANTAKGEVWKCVVTPGDGTTSGPAAEDQVTIQNSAPTAPVATVTPETPDGSTDLVCSITTQSTDADGDTITYTYQWYKDGVVQSGLTTDTVGAAETAKGQVWKCVVTPSDGTASGSPAEDEATVTGSAGGFPMGAIAGIVIGVLALKSLFCFLLWLRRKKKKKKEEAQPPSQGTPAP
jgi:Tol biopolymer transport system component